MSSISAGRVRMALIGASLAALALPMVAAQAVTTSPGVLGGFQQDGNQVVDDNPDITADDGQIDWATATVKAATIPATDDSTDSGFQGSSKELKPSDWTCNTGGADPAKGNLLRTYIDPRPADGYIDLAWVRETLTSSGDVEVDFELNQAEGPAGDCKITRTEGDVLIAYKFPGGSAAPVLLAYAWSPLATPTTSADGSWVDLNLTAADVKAAVNSGAALTDDVMTLAADDAIGAESFGEATLALAALFNSGNREDPLPCRNFGYLNIRSKSSRENDATALQDRMPAQDIDLDSCGGIKLAKINDHDPAQAIEGVEFSVYSSAAETEALDTCITDSEGICEFSGLAPGNYWLRETGTPTNYDGYGDAFGPVSVVGLLVTDLTDEPFVNNRQTGFIAVTKALIDPADEGFTVGDGALLDGATFVAYVDSNDDGTYQTSEAAHLWPSETTVASCTTAGGTGGCTIGPLPTGDYRVTETVAPAETLNTSVDTDVTVTEGTVEAPVGITLTNSLGPLDLTLVKDGPAAAYVGDTITYTFTLTTTGPKLHAASVTEMLDGRCASTPVLDTTASTGTGDGFLDAGDSWVMTCDHLITAHDLTQLNSAGELENTAYASGADTFGRLVDSAPDDHQVLVVVPGISLTKTVNGGESADVIPGDDLNYVIKITNTGNVELTITSLTDSLHDPLPASCAALIGTLLAPGASTQCSYTDVATKNADNVAVVLGRDTTIGDPAHDVTARDTASVDVAEVLGEVFTRDELPRTGVSDSLAEAFVLLAVAGAARRLRRRSLA